MHLDDLLPYTAPNQANTIASEWPLRIAMLSAHTSPLSALGARDTGGMNVYIRQLAVALTRRGIGVDVFTRRADPDTPEVQEPVPGFRTIGLRAGPLAPVARAELYELLPAFVDQVECFRAKHDIRYDALHSHYWLSGLAARPLARLWDVPWVHMSHTLAALKNEHLGGEQTPESELRIRSEEEVLAAADGVIASNQVERDELLTHYHVAEDRVFVAPCGVDLDRFHSNSRRAARKQLAIPLGQYVVLYVGRIEPLKGLDTLLRATALLKHRVTDLKVLIVGGVRGQADPETEREMERLLTLGRELDVMDVVRFHGPAPHEELPLFYRAANVSVVPSHYESFGMAALESLACGTPVVASRVGGLQSTIRDGRNGFLVPVGDEQAFAQRIEQLLCRPELAARMSTEAARTACRYSWDRVADANLGVYYNVRTARETGVVLVGLDL